MYNTIPVQQWQLVSFRLSADPLPGYELLHEGFITGPDANYGESQMANRINTQPWVLGPQSKKNQVDGEFARTLYFFLVYCNNNTASSERMDMNYSD